MIHTIDFLCDN